MAVSPNGRYVIATCEDPAVSYLTDLQGCQKTLVLKADLSRTPVTVAAFHPDRAGIFLLGFRDGQIAAFDGQMILDNTRDREYFDPEICVACELRRLGKVHRTVNVGGHCGAETFANAAFLPSYKTRAVTVGHDGNCRLVDLGKTARVLRTWRLASSAVAVAVCKKDDAGRIPAMANQTQDCVIAVALKDCSVSLYDALGTFLCRRALPGPLTRLLTIEWIPGAMPQSRNGRRGRTSRHLTLPSLPNSGKDTLANAAYLQQKAVRPTCEAKRTTLSDQIVDPPVRSLQPRQPSKWSRRSPDRSSAHSHVGEQRRGRAKERRLVKSTDKSLGCRQLETADDFMLQRDQYVGHSDGLSTPWCGESQMLQALLGSSKTLGACSDVPVRLPTQSSRDEHDAGECSHVEVARNDRQASVDSWLHEASSVYPSSVYSSTPPDSGVLDIYARTAQILPTRARTTNELRLNMTMAPHLPDLDMLDLTGRLSGEHGEDSARHAHTTDTALHGSSHNTNAPERHMMRFSRHPEPSPKAIARSPWRRLQHSRIE